jgi:hypothetical protein
VQTPDDVQRVIGNGYQIIERVCPPQLIAYLVYLVVHLGDGTCFEAAEPVSGSGPQEAPGAGEKEAELERRGVDKPQNGPGEDIVESVFI